MNQCGLSLSLSFSMKDSEICQYDVFIIQSERCISISGHTCTVHYTGTNVCLIPNAHSNEVYSLFFFRR